LDAFDVRPSRSTFDAAFGAAALVTFLALDLAIADLLSVRRGGIAHASRTRE
jgi:hypothetical protein